MKKRTPTLGSLRFFSRASLLISLLGAVGASLGGCSSNVERGTVGESCQARSDCAEGLACMREVCVMTATELSVTGKSCDAIACATDAECCAGFVPDSSCDVYDAACQANPNDCLAFQTLCVCNEQCQGERCVDTGPQCLADADCPSLLFPYCVTEQCVECRDQTDCASTDRCIEGMCQPPCQTDDECALLHACEAGDCVYVGCSSDRECVFLLGDTRAVCDEMAGCSIACEVDADCDFQRFEICSNARCTFVGCESDAECRAYLELDPDSGLQAVCR